MAKWPRSKDEDFQKYRMRLEHAAYHHWADLIRDQYIDTVVNETIPAVGFNVSTQSYLANCVATTLHCAAFGWGCNLSQISARSVQTRIAVRKDTKKITKAQVRNGVIEIIPGVGKELTHHLMEWDRWDAIAIGLCYLGYKL